MSGDAQKFEVLSPEWMALGEKFLKEEAAKRADALKGVRFAICEYFSGVPAHLAPNGLLDWRIVFDGSQVEWKKGAVENPDIRLDFGYEHAVFIGKTTSTEMMQQPGAQDSMPEFPPAVGETVAAAHDRLVERTL